MSRVTCRCGEVINVKADAGPERVDCPKCGARIRLRRRSSASSLIGGVSESDDGFIRFLCPCGRRLKVRAAGGQQAGKCPDCGRLVPVPGSPGATGVALSSARIDPDARTADLDPDDIARLEEWSTRHTGRAPGGGGTTTRRPACRTSRSGPPLTPVDPHHRWPPSRPACASAPAAASPSISVPPPAANAARPSRADERTDGPGEGEMARHQAGSEGTP